ncbi:hypothetical protein B0H13DRAFT_2275181 [Mycena leptocephala]|nr:hypothetical protein B0H13DRAFT_2275181 [Mycena leptocephala]
MAQLLRGEWVKRYRGAGDGPSHNNLVAVLNDSILPDISVSHQRAAAQGVITSVPLCPGRWQGGCLVRRFAVIRNSALTFFLLVIRLCALNYAPFLIIALHPTQPNNGSHTSGQAGQKSVASLKTGMRRRNHCASCPTMRSSIWHTDVPLSLEAADGSLLTPEAR